MKINVKGTDIPTYIVDDTAKPPAGATVNYEPPEGVMINIGSRHGLQNLDEETEIEALGEFLMSQDEEAALEELMKTEER